MSFATDRIFPAAHTTSTRSLEDAADGSSADISSTTAFGEDSYLATSGVTLTHTTVSLTEITTTDLADNFKVRVYLRNSAVAQVRIDLWTVAGSSYSNFTLYESSIRDQSSGTLSTSVYAPVAVVRQRALPAVHVPNDRTHDIDDHLGELHEDVPLRHGDDGEPPVAELVAEQAHARVLLDAGDPDGLLGDRGDADGVRAERVGLADDPGVPAGGALAGGDRDVGYAALDDGDAGDWRPPSPATRAGT